MAADQLKLIIGQTLSPYAETRKNAEKQLEEEQKRPGHQLAILQLVATSDGAGADAAVRQAAAVHFKNVVKKGWDVNREEGNDGIVISAEDRNTIKSHLVQLMCTTPAQIQVQLSESISLIAKVDYPQQWQNLLPELVQQFNSADPAVVVGVLKTANSIFKSFRYVQRTDALYSVIAYTLKIIQAPLLSLFKTTGQAVDAMTNDPVQLKFRLDALLLMCRIFYSLNYQDLPEYFEDHMSEWMQEFAKYLRYQNPVLTDADEEVEPSPIDSLQAAIIENLGLYSSKDEEEFMKHLPTFTTLVWNLLLGITSYPKHDVLATTSIRFLTSLIEKRMHQDLFKDEATLRQIIGKIVIPNLMFRESDEEKFEDDPRDYILMEVEGSDSESRRKCSQDLLRGMCRHFGKQTTSICSEHVGSMLSEYSADPNGKWKAKDAAIQLMIGIAVVKQSSAGVSEVNSDVDIMDVFQKQILPELQDLNHSSRPVVKATSIKFVSIFRNQFSKENLVQLFPLLIPHLGSPIVVVHTFAAYTMERILTTKEEVAGKKRPRIDSSELKQFMEPLFTGLFAVVDNEEHNENDYVMKCVMRSLATAGQDVVPVTEIVITKLTSALGRVAKNPRNPQFNHYLFESIAVLVKSVCSQDPSATSSFEPLLFEPFNIILQMDIVEFTPYVFQIMAQLLEYRPDGTGLGQAYTDLFQPLLTPALWEKRGNVPALARLIKAYIRKSAAEVVGRLVPILGVFQKLLSIKATEASAFEILNASIIYFPLSSMESALPTIFQLLLTRLQTGRTPKYVRLVTGFFALFIAKHGSQIFFDRLSAIQAALGQMILADVWNPRIISDPPRQRIEAKIQIIALTKITCDNSCLLPDGKQIWCQTIASLVTLLTSSTFTGTDQVADDDIEVEIGYDAQFSQLAFATRAAEDPFAEVADPSFFFVQSLHRLLSSQPGELRGVIQQGLSSDPKLATGLETMFKTAGLSLV